MTITRRDAMVIAAGAFATASTLRPASAVADDAERHGISAFGDLKYPADFKRLDYVDANAPKGGTYSEVVTSRGYNGSFLTFTSLNGYILRGEGAFGMDLTFASLMARAADEPDSMYAFAARSRASSRPNVHHRLQRVESSKNEATIPLCI